MRGSAAVLLLGFALATAPARGAGDDDSVIVIRGSEVSVARPLSVERASDGRTEVEIVRVQPAPPPPPPRKPPEPEREIVVVYVPVEQPVAPRGIPIGWVSPRWGWERHHRDRHDPFARSFHPFGSHRSPVRRNLHGR